MSIFKWFSNIALDRQEKRAQNISEYFDDREVELVKAGFTKKQAKELIKQAKMFYVIFN